MQLKLYYVTCQRFAFSLVCKVINAVNGGAPMVVRRGQGFVECNTFALGRKYE